MQGSRRDVIRQLAAGLILVETAVGLKWQTPAQAAAGDAPLRVLSPAEGLWVAALGEAIAPPSRAAGLVHFIDHHLAQPPADCLLGIRYLDVLPPYLNFYRPALASLYRLYGPPPPADNPQWAAILAKLAGPPVPAWTGPPPGLFLFVARLDAVDIAYGTRAGFARLGVDYLPHIEPETDW